MCLHKYLHIYVILSYIGISTYLCRYTCQVPIRKSSLCCKGYSSQRALLQKRLCPCIEPTIQRQPVPSVDLLPSSTQPHCRHLNLPNSLYLREYHSSEPLLESKNSILKESGLIAQERNDTMRSPNAGHCHNKLVKQL